MSLQRFDPVGFRQRLISTCEAVGKSNPALAEMCGMPTSTLEMYLYTNTLPGARALFNLAQGLNVSTDWLLFGGRDVRRVA